MAWLGRDMIRIPQGNCNATCLDAGGTLGDGGEGGLLVLDLLDLELDLVEGHLGLLELLVGALGTGDELGDGLLELEDEVLDERHLAVLVGVDGLEVLAQLDHTLGLADLLEEDVGCDIQYTVSTNEPIHSKYP